MKGKIYLIPVTLGDNQPQEVLPASVFSIIDTVDFYMAENIRSARRFLRKAGIKKSISELTFFELNKHTNQQEAASFLAPALAGKNMGIISEAGMPGIADPGSHAVKAAHQKGLEVVPLVGPSSIFLALTAAGMNGQNFAFSGYLPIKQPERIKKIRQLEMRSRNENQTQIFMETPYRNNPLFKDILQTCGKNTRICIATDITLETEFIKTKTVAQWKNSLPDLHKRPTIFILDACNK